MLRLRGDSLDEIGEVGFATDGVELLAAVEFFAHRDEVDGAALLHEVEGGGVDAAVGVEGEVFGLEPAGGVVDGEGVKEHGSQNCYFCMEGGWEPLDILKLSECGHASFSILTGSGTR